MYQMAITQMSVSTMPKCVFEETTFAGNHLEIVIFASSGMIFVHVLPPPTFTLSRFTMKLER